MTTRRQFLTLSALSLALAPSARSAITLAPEKCFLGRSVFESLCGQARSKSWRSLPMPQRMIAIAKVLEGIPYVGYTLEIDDHVECPSANFNGLDCWTFFELVLAFARLIDRPEVQWDWRGLLSEVEWTRYRGGVCRGHYLERIHYLDEWFFDNWARQNVWDFTRTLPGAIRLTGRESTEMTKLWKSYRYLRENPEYRPTMRKWEQYVEAQPVWYIPKAQVPAIEPQLRDGDIIGIVTNQTGGVCSHVGLARRDPKTGVMRFMHASANAKKVIWDQRLSSYLSAFRYHAGIIAARPLPTNLTLRDGARYKARLAELRAGKVLANPAGV